jgi:hypothetical protein
VQPLGQPGEVVTGLPALLANPGQDELAADEMVPNLFRRVAFGIEEGRQRLITAVPCAIRPGDLDLVPNPAFNRQRRDIHPWTEIDSDLKVPQLDGGRYPMNGDIGGSERGPKVVGVRA